MIRKSLLWNTILIIVSLLSCIPAYAFQVNQTASGLDMKWSTPNTSIVINAAGGPSGTVTAFQAAMQSWTDVPASAFTFTYGGPSTSTAHKTNNGVNLVNFAAMGTSSGVLAENAWWYNPTTGQIVDSDIQFNTSYSWVTDGSSGAYDLQSVATHELGHSLSLKDLYNGSDSEKTMYGYASAGETKKRTLDQDDSNGIAYLYPGVIAPDSILMVVRASDNSLWDSSFDSSGTFNNDWASISGMTPSTPALARNPSANKLQMVVRAADNSLWASSFNSSGTFNNNWASISGMTPSVPSLAWNPSANKLQMVVRAADNSLWASSFNSSGTFNNDWASISGMTPSTPSIAWNPSANKLQMIVRAADDSLWQASFNSSGTFNNDWVPISGMAPSTPALAWNPSANKLQMIVRAADDSLWQASFNSSGTFNNDWTPIPGEIPSTPALAWISSATKLQMVVRSFDDSLWQASFNSSGVFNNDWTAISGGTPSSPSLAGMQ